MPGRDEVPQVERFSPALIDDGDGAYMRKNGVGGAWVKLSDYKKEKARADELAATDEAQLENRILELEAELAQARNQERQRIQEALTGEDGLARLQCALSEDGWMLESHPCYDDAEKDRLRDLLRREVSAILALDTLDPSGEESA